MVLFCTHAQPHGTCHLLLLSVNVICHCRLLSLPADDNTLQEVRKAQAANRARLDEEYRRLVGNLIEAQQLRGGEEWLANPALPEDIVRESMPGTAAAVLQCLRQRV
jgi:hypothetical protein